jgi:uroporphyrinogen III methyltransferase / synthase
MSKPGKTYLVGAGPGDLGLVTLRARELVERADVLIYDYLCNPELLRWARPGAEKIYVGKSAGNHTLSQDEINALLVKQARAGKIVVRLKGGDPYVFGRGGEEAEVLLEAGLEFEEVPGITSAIAAPAYAGIPVTHRECASSFTVVTGHEDPSKENSALDWKALASDRGTRIFLMGVERLPQITSRLMSEGADPATPVALVRWGTTGRQESVEGTLATIADIVRQRGFKAPAVTIVGNVVKLRRELNWFEHRPLFDKRIVVTRTRSQASALSGQLRELGADVLEIPTIRIVPVAADDLRREQLRLLSGLYDWIVFTSPNAVDIFFEQFFAVHKDIRALGTIQIAAVGPATTARLRALHIESQKQPREFTTEALAAEFSDGEIMGRRFLLPRSNLANPVLSASLREHGGQVTEWVLYETVAETADETGTRERYQLEGADWITFTSSSTVENWHALKLSLQPGARIPKYASIGPVTSAALRKLGYSVDIEAESYTISGLVCRLLNGV